MEAYGKRIQFTSNELDTIRTLYIEGTPILKIAERFHVDFSVISDRLKRWGSLNIKDVVGVLKK